MSAHDQAPDEQPEDLDQQAAHQEEERRRPGAANAVIGWAISGAVHGLAVILAMFAVFGAPANKEEDIPPVRINPIEPPTKPPEQQKTQEVTLEAKMEIETTQVSEKPAAQPAVDTPTETPVDTPVEKPAGREEATGSIETGGQSTNGFMAIGPGGGASGAFGMRTGGAKKKAIVKGGASKRSEAAVDKSLEWFKRHQSPNGGWEYESYYKNCTTGAKCEPSSPSGWQVQSDINVATTGYAVLCYLGAGYEHRTPNKYRAVVKKGIDYLLSKQTPDGMFGKKNYEHPVAVMALAEAYAMTGDTSLRGPTQKGIDRLLARQFTGSNALDSSYSGPLGWDYVAPKPRMDSSVTGWNIMALKSALAAGFNVGRGWDGSKKWMELHWKASNWNTWQKLTKTDKSDFMYCWQANVNPGAPQPPKVEAKKETKDAKDTKKDPKAPVEVKNPGGEEGGFVTGGNRQFIGLVCAIFLGHTNGDVMVETLANAIMASQMPRGYPTNTYQMYYNTMAIFQVGGDRWSTWNASVRDMLVDAQRKDNNCFDGSWDFEKTGHTSEIGRLLSTAYCTLCLEVYYRYAQVKDLHK